MRKILTSCLKGWLLSCEPNARSRFELARLSFARTPALLSGDLTPKTNRPSCDLATKFRSLTRLFCARIYNQLSQNLTADLATDFRSNSPVLLSADFFELNRQLCAQNRRRKSTRHQTLFAPTASLVAFQAPSFLQMMTNLPLII